MHKRFRTSSNTWMLRSYELRRAWTGFKSRYGSLEQMQLMLEMQGLRFMHCTMWTEGVREMSRLKSLTSSSS